MPLQTPAIVEISALLAILEIRLLRFVVFQCRFLAVIFVSAFDLHSWHFCHPINPQFAAH
ncbi:hypothetical protein CW304_13555 [Bacillus sp. UFRGS-B20]|nr:hypothetical protein CW304_13555 [Bacillus sp. UFRGS-B20]